MALCGEKGHLTKQGLPCGYFVRADEEACPHHSADKSRARAFQSRGGLISNLKELPSWLDVNEFESTTDIRKTLAGIAREVASNAKADLKRATVLIATCNAANTVLQTEAVRELNDTMLRAEGHGPALIILEGLKQRGRKRRLPGMEALQKVQIVTTEPGGEESHE